MPPQPPRDEARTGPSAATPDDGKRPHGRPRQPGDGWVDCACGQRHWGLHGAAGLLLVRRGPDGAPLAVVLQHRALWSHHGGTWGVPGGARGPDESAEQAALREAHEEAGIDAAAVGVRDTWVLTHPDWSYTTVIADEVVAIHPTVTDAESDEIAWIPLDEVDALPLLPAFADAWPTLRERITEPDRRR